MFVMYENKKELLSKLEFGNVDSESELDLDRKFIKTKDFEQFINPQKSLVLGAKGSGKSALFQMFSKYEQVAKKLAGLDRKIIIVTGTGFNDLKELQTDDFRKLLRNEEADFNKIWELYIAVKIAIKIGGKYSIDTQDLLGDINDVLEQECLDCWILFDKIDELFFDDYEKRKICIESLFRTYLSFVNRFPRIKFKIFLRNDIWSTLEFVNKSHLSDKSVVLSWDKKDLLIMLMRRCLNNEMVEEYVVNEIGLEKEELLLAPNLEETFYTIFARQVYKGKKEANMIDWLLQRITDGLGGKYPREFINFANYSKEAQEEIENFEDNCLISGMAVKKAFSKVSEVKCDTYLSEFPKLRKHFDRFKGKDTARYSREEIFVLMDGLEPQGDDMLQELYETGMLEAKGGKAFADNLFEIPKLYRMGLGLVLRGRP